MAFAVAGVQQLAGNVWPQSNACLPVLQPLQQGAYCSLYLAMCFAPCALQAIHGCAVKFPDVAANVVHLLMDFLGDTATASSLDVVFFVREIMETNAKLRPSILERLRDTFYSIR